LLKLTCVIRAFRSAIGSCKSGELTIDSTLSLY